MSLDLPASIERYFTSCNAADAEAAASSFAMDAIVHDEGRDHVGRVAIRRWVQDTIDRYATRVVIEGASESDDATRVVAQVSGSFPGSPIRLRFSFQLADALISRLDIGPPTP